MDINKHVEAIMNIYNVAHRSALSLFLCISFFSQILPVQSTECNITSRFAGSMLAGGIGDFLGRVTEFKKSPAIFKQYPHGVRSCDDFLPEDWANVPVELKNKKIAPYTDDTAMAKLVMKELINAREHDWDLNETMCNIATSFIHDSHDTQLGWIAPFRAPGNACIAGV